MALLKFLKGNYSSLSTKDITEGQVLICGDTGEMFVDVAADKRVKIGDFVVVPTLEALEALDATVVPTSRLYYVEDGNILARSNGAGWTQINKQKTLAELGGVSSSTYATDKTNLLQADADNATAIEKVKTLVGSIPKGATATTVVDYIDEKVAGIASDATVTALVNRVTTAEGKLDTLTGEESVAGSVKAIAKNYADGKDAAIAEAKDAAAAAQADVDALKGTIDSAVEAATADLDYTATGMAKSKTIKSLTQVDGKIAAEFEDIEVAQSQVTGLSTTLSGLSAAIDTEKSRAEEIEGGLRTDVNAIKADYLKAADKTALQNAIDTEKGRLNTFLASAEVGEAAVDTLKEIQNYINTHGEAAATMTQNIADNAKAISDEVTRAKSAEKANADAITALGTSVSGTYETKTDASAKLTEAKGYADNLNTAMGERVDVLEAASHTHDNKALLDTYTQTEANLADAVAKKHDHANAEELAKIKAGDKAKWDTAQANAEATAAAALGAAKTELEGSIATKAAASDLTAEVNRAKAAEEANATAIEANATEIAKKANSADVYTKTETYTKTEVQELISWGSF